MLCPKISEAKRSTGDAGVTGTLYFTSAILITIYFVCPTTTAGLLDPVLQAGYQCRITVNLFPVLNKFYKFPVVIAARGEFWCLLMQGFPGKTDSTEQSWQAILVAALCPVECRTLRIGIEQDY